MNLLKKIAIDLVKALSIGIAAGCILGAIVFIVAYIAYGLSVATEATKDGLFLTIGLVTLFLAGSIISKGHDISKKTNGSYTKYFKILSFRYVIALVDVGLIIVAAVLDYLI